MSEMVERVARAIYDAPTKFDGDQVGVHLSYSMMIDDSAVTAADLRSIVMSVCLDAARAAIEAMRITETKDGVPGGIAFEDAFFGGGETVFHAMQNAWNATIDAALEAK